VTIYAHAFWAWYPWRRRRWVAWFVLGAIMPDLPYVVVFAVASLRAGPGILANLGLWNSLWRNPLVCALHSLVPWSVVLLGGVVIRRARHPAFARLTTSFVAWIAGWGSHVFLDTLTHRSDGYPIFWPLSAYRFSTPISYWEPSFHGVAFALVCDGSIAFLLLRLAALRLRRPPSDGSVPPRADRDPTRERMARLTNGLMSRT
jgi:membrane-bound metal-dependent hydrolase YbcI (DUF457 family)